MPPNELTDRALLEQGEIEILGRMPWSSNGTFLVECCLDGRTARGIYKPHKGERPLWDFPDGLYRREVAAYELSDALGWDLVPLTVVREEGPLGIGSLQAFVDADFEQHYFTLVEDETHHDTFRRMAAFDFVANNTDRKSGHCLIDTDAHIWGIDNGLSFHADFKLRTVIWEFGGETIEDDVLARVDRFVERMPVDVAALLDDDEIAAMSHRATKLVTERRFPVDDGNHRYPWPLV